MWRVQVSVPLAALAVRAAGLGMDGWLRAVQDERVQSALKLSFGAAFAAAVLASLAGALIGATVAHYMPAEWLNKMLPVIVFAGGLYLLFGGTPKTPIDNEAPIKKKWQLPQGFSLGFYDGVAGPGTGAFWTVSSMLLYPIDLVKASGVARSMNFVSNIAALSVFIFSGHVDWIIGLTMGFAVMIGAYFGARSAISGGAKFIRPVFITVVLGLTVRLAWQHWFSVA